MIHTFLDPLVECQVKSFLRLIIYSVIYSYQYFHPSSCYHLLPQLGTLHLTLHVYLRLGNRLSATTLTPSLIVTSSQVRVGMPLPLLLCCISGLGPEGLRHNCTIPVVSLGTTQGDPCVFLREVLPTRTFHAKLNGQSAVSTRCPTTLQHMLKKQVTSSRELHSTRDFLHTHLQEPEFILVHK